MKTKLLVTLFLTLLVFKTNAQCTDYVNIPDSNFKNDLLNNHTIDTNNDDEISCLEASDYTGGIFVNNESISDLTGIEAFINITQLNCSYNSLTSLDVSKNVALNFLNCDGNDLINLELTKNIALEELRCSSNDLASIDVTQNTTLTSFWCLSNTFESLDVSNNTALTSLRCSFNPLTSLDVANNSALEYLETDFTDLTTLDVSANPVLTVIICNNSDLTSLNIANGNNTNMFVDVNDYYTSDFRNNSSLTCIQVDDVAYSNNNWSDIIDDTQSYSEDCNAALSTDEVFTKNLSIYPNPVVNILNINLKQGEELEEAQLYSLLGKRILKTTKTNINTTNLSKGMYILKVKNKEGKTAIKKIIKK